MKHSLLIAFAIQKYGKCFWRGQGTDDAYTPGWTRP